MLRSQLACAVQQTLDMQHQQRADWPLNALPARSRAEGAPAACGLALRAAPAAPSASGSAAAQLYVSCLRQSHGADEGGMPETALAAVAAGYSQPGSSAAAQEQLCTGLAQEGLASSAAAPWRWALSCWALLTACRRSASSRSAFACTQLPAHVNCLGVQAGARAGRMCGAV